MNSRSLFNATLLTLVLAIAAASQGGSTAVGTRVVEAQLASRLMARKMPYRVMLPAGYDKSGERYSVLYLLHGFAGSYKNWFDKTAVAEYSSEKHFIIVTPEGENGWYTDIPTKPNTNYESYIVKELIPEVDSKYRTIDDRRHRVIAGLSMGGYGAIKIALRSRSMFSLAGSFSGALSASSYKDVGVLPAGSVSRSMLATFGEPNSDVHKVNDLLAMVASESVDQIKTMPMLYIACGTEDPYFASNDTFRGLLLQKKIPHEFRERPGVHDWKFWDSQIEEFLVVAERFVGKS